MSIKLSAIFIYPVKALRGTALSEVQVLPAGPAGDRRWVITDPAGQFISQRSHPSLAMVDARATANGILLRAPGRPDLAVDRPVAAGRRDVQIWRDEVSAAAAAPAADRWLSEFLGEPCHLSWMDPDCRRPVTSSQGRSADVVSFADGYPALVLGAASLEELNRRLESPLPVDRFRPNFVVSGCEAFAEDGWTRIAVGEAIFRVAGPCARCSVTTVNQVTGRSEAPEPLRTLATFRQHPSGVIFGTNLLVDRPGLVREGDAVVPLD